MSKITKVVEVTAIVEVEFDTSKFTPQVMKEFSEVIFRAETIQEHAEHLAQLCARDMTYGFVEGYGELEDVGVQAKTVESWTTSVEARDE